MKLLSQVGAYQGPDVSSFRTFINETFSAPIDPSIWYAFGSGSIVSGQYLFPSGLSGGIETVQTIPAGATFTMDVIVPNCPEGDQFFSICGFQYDFVTNSNARLISLYLQCHSGVITGCQVADGLFVVNVPLNLLTITGNTVVFPQFSMQVHPGAFIVSIGGTQVVNFSNTIYQPASGIFFLSNNSYSGVSLAFDNIVITEGDAAWMGLKGLPGITVLQGLSLSSPLDSRGHGHAEDILPIGTNFAILVLTKGTDASGNVIDGFDTLADLEGPHHTGQDWDKISDDLGGLVFFGALTNDAKKQFQAEMKGYSQQYS